MNRLLSKVLVASVFFVLAMGATAFGQLLEGSLHVYVPFRFYAGDTWLPAGTYTIRALGMDEPRELVLRNANDTVEVLLVTESTDRPDTPAGSALDFDRVGKKDFLSTVWVEGSKTGFHLSEPRLEKRMLKAALKKEKHSIKARHTKP